MTTEKGMPAGQKCIYALESREKKVLLLKAAGLLAIAAYIFYSNLLISLIFALCAFFLSKRLDAYLLTRKKRELTYQFKDALYALSIAIAAGRPLKEALDEALASTRLIYGNAGAIVIELDRLVNNIKKSNEMEEMILLDFSRRCGIAEIANFSDVYLTARKTGGDLPGIIMKAADMIMEKIAISREIAVMTAQKKLECHLLTIFPFVSTGILKVTSPDYIMPLYETGQGRIIMTVALAGIVASIIMMHKINDIEI